MTTVKPIVIACLLPLIGCTLAGKVGLSSGDSPVAGPSAQMGQPPEQPSQALASPENPPTGVPTSGLAATPAQATTPMQQPVEVARAVKDTVGPIPESLRVSPSKGAPVISLKGPSWCESVSGKNTWGKSESTEREFTSAIEYAHDIYEVRVMGEIAEFACAGSRSADRFSWVRSYMQARANASGMPEQHQAFLFSVVASTSISSTPDNCTSYELKGDSTQLEKYHNQAFMVGMGCSRSGESNSLTWWLDRSIELDSHVKRMALVYSVFKDGGNDLSAVLGAYHDLKLLNFDAYFAEMKKFGADDAQLGRGMMKYYDFQYLYKQWSSYNEKEYGKNFSYVKNLASDGFDQWVQDYRANTKAVQFAFGIEESLLKEDKQGFVGCSKKADAFVRKLIMRNKPKTKEDILIKGSHGITSLVLVAAYECEKHKKNPIMARAYVDMLDKMEQTRGPRYAARMAVQHALLKKHKTNSSYPIRATFVPPRMYDAFGDRRADVSSSSTGTIKRISKKGEFLEIQFEDIVRNDKHYNCVKTGVKGYRASGNFKHSQRCNQAASSRDVIKVAPVRIPKESGLGLKKGQYATIAKSEDDSKTGFPLEIYKSKAQEHLINFYGMKL